MKSLFRCSAFLLFLALPANSSDRGFYLERVFSQSGHVYGYIVNDLEYRIYCYIDANEFSVMAKSTSRAYPYYDDSEWNCE